MRVLMVMIMDDNNVTRGLPAEIKARKAADAKLQGNINSEASARKAADTAFKNQIDDIAPPSSQ